MSFQIERLRERLSERAATVLRDQSANNRGGLPPTRLPQVARRIIGGLATYATRPDTTSARDLGRDLGQQGLGIHSLLALTGALQREALAQADTREHAASLMLTIGDYIALVAGALAEVERLEGARYRQQVEQALSRTREEQRAQESELRKVIQDLSTPIIPVHKGVLVLPLVGNIDNRRAQEITERLLTAIAERQAEIVILDITGVPVIDTGVANHLLMTARAARLLGAMVLLVGISAEIAHTIVHIGVTMADVVVLADLQSGIAYALERLGLGIMPLPARAVAAPAAESRAPDDSSSAP